MCCRRLTLWLLLSAAAWADEEQEVGTRTIVFELEHMMQGSWRPRGQIEVAPFAPKSRMATATTFSLSKDDAKELWDLCEKKGFYRIRAKDEKNIYAATSVPACDLFALRFRETLELQLTAKAELLSLSYKNLPSSAVTLNPPAEDLQFETSAAVALDVVGQIIPVQIAASRKPPAGVDYSHDEPAIGDEQPKPEQKGFFQKYWHIIIPVLLIYLTAKSPEPPPGEGGGGGDKNAAPAPAPSS